MDLVLATNNEDKREELVESLRDVGITIRHLKEFRPVPEIEEDGQTCGENALKKATIVARHTGLLTLADDTGLEVEALGGRPGVYAARYAGEEASYQDNCRKLLQELEGTPLGQRHARFLTAIAMVDPQNQTSQVVEGVLEGRIAERPSGQEGFGYDPVFEVPEMKKTLAELTLDQKNKISHRGRALQKAKQVLEHYLVAKKFVGA